MPKIVSVVPKWRFDATGATVPKSWEMIFVDAEDDAALMAACKGADALLAPSGFQKITAELLHRNSQLKLVQESGAGFDGADIQTARELGIPVANVPGANAHEVAEYTIGLMIAMQRCLIIADRETKAGQYLTVRKQMFLHGLGDMPSSTIGLVGLGAIGRRVAEIARFLGAKVVYYNRTRLATEKEDELGLEYSSLPELLAHSDIVSLHIPLTPQTRGLIGKKEMLLMKPSSYLINTARGDIIDQIALAEILESGRIAGAAVDVFYPEPPPAEHPLLTLSPTAQDRLIVTPHMGGVTANCFRRMLEGAIENIRRVCDGEAPQNVVNGL
ncbi:MAG: hypothetical protein GYA36_03010 [Veillonellaceae bacterium]|nr:hypothetical protein [Veillonellaceae bacterium]